MLTYKLDTVSTAWTPSERIDLLRSIVEAMMDNESTLAVCALKSICIHVILDRAIKLEEHRCIMKTLLITVDRKMETQRCKNN